MSFILDALKKSENERARQNGPALLEARVVPRRRGIPAWAIVVGVVLLANLGVLGFVLLRSPPQPAPVSAAAAPGAAAPVATEPVAAQPAPQPAPQPAAAPPPAQIRPLPPPPVAESAAVNPADFQPARPPDNAAQMSNASLPSAADLSGSGLPELRLALHVFDVNPANRYVLLNSQRLREGEATVDGVRVETINPDAVVLSWRGQRFRLKPGG